MADDGRLVQVARRGPAAVITLDSPHNRNALSRALLAQLHATLLGAFAEDGVRVVVLTGTEPAFCSGADLKEQRAGGPPPVVGFPDVLTTILEAPLPVVARVNGVARAGGLGLIAACDLAVGLADATFGFSEVRIGVAPAIIAVTCLRRMDRQAARELFLTGAPFDGTRAREVGLLDRAVDADELDRTVDELVDQLALGPPGRWLPPSSCSASCPATAWPTTCAAWGSCRSTGSAPRRPARASPPCSRSASRPGSPAAPFPPPDPAPTADGRRLSPCSGHGTAIGHVVHH